MQMAILDKCVVTVAMALVAAALAGGLRRAVAAGMSIAALTWLYPFGAVGFAVLAIGFLVLTADRRDSGSVPGASPYRRVYRRGNHRIIDTEFVKGKSHG